jgi:hypothetical protein
MIAVDLGNPYTSHFPQYQLDQITPYSGLEGFEVTVWLGNVVTAVPTTVAEIGTSGTYAVSFTPTSVGIWSVEVYGPTTGDRWADEIHVTQAPLAWQFTAADDGTAARFAIWLERDGVVQLDLDSLAAAVHTPDGAMVQDLGTDSADTGDGIFAFTLPSASLLTGQEYYLACVATRGALTWHNNLGFSKV